MLFFINIPARVVGLLESNVSPREIAAGVCLGMFLGFIPLNGPAAFLLILFFFILKINRVSTLLTMPLFKAAYLLGVSGVLERFGGYLLIDVRPLSGFWAIVTGLPLVAYLDLNNTLVAGGLAASAALSIPLYFIAKRLSAALRTTYAAKVKNSKIARAISGLKIAGKIDGVVKADSGVGLYGKGLRQLMFASIKARIFGRKAPPKGFRKRVNITGLAVIVLVLIVIQYGVGLAISPMAGRFLIDTMNRAAGTKIAAERVNIWPLTLSFSMSGLKAFDPERPDERILKADAASFRMSPMALLSKRVVFSSVHLKGAEIDLEGRPDGSFNVQNLTRPAGAADEGAAGIKSVWRLAQQNKDWFGKLYGFIEKRFSKEAKAKRKLERQAGKLAKTVAVLPEGRRVNFKRGRGAYLFEIRDLDIRDGYVKIKAEGQALELDKARIRLGGLAVDPENGARIGLFSIRGDVSKEGSLVGSADILFSQTENAARFDARLKEIDLDAVRFVYQKSLPVNVAKGRITLSSRTALRGDAIESRTTLSMTSHALEPKSPGQLAFGVIPVSAITDALNGIDPVRLTFVINGTVEKPEFGGFRESLMALVNPYISNIKDKVIRKGTDALKEIIGKKLWGGSEEKK